mgnify:CR=1 FL=1
MRNEKKLTSIRFDVPVLEAAEKFVAERRYWKKSDVINSILAAVFENFGQNEIYDMVRTWAWKDKKVETKFEITDERRPKKP